jgi:hypothetical protein
MYLRNRRRQVLAQMYYHKAKGPNQKLMSSSQECFGDEQTPQNSWVWSQLCPE